jgi:DNA repair protein RadC
VRKDKSDFAIVGETSTGARQPSKASPSKEHIEWRCPTTALRDYLDSLGVSEPGMVARALIGEFGSLSDLLSASWWRLRRIGGARLANTIRASRDLMRAALAEPLEDGPVVPRSKELLRFLQAQIGFSDHECLLVLYVDAQLRLIRIQRLCEGNFHEAPIDFRRVIACGISVGASGFLLVHNHPSGIPTPSRDDVLITRRLRHLAAELDLHLLDHLIVARGKFGTVEDFWREARTSEKQE